MLMELKLNKHGIIPGLTQSNVIGHDLVNIYDNIILKIGQDT